MRVSTAKIAPDNLWAYKVVPWPSNYVTAFPPVVSVLRDEPVPDQGKLDASGRIMVYNSGSYERGAVDVFRDGPTLTAKVMQSGNQTVTRANPSGSGAAAAAMAYHVRVQNINAEARDYFIRFVAPKPLRIVTVAYSVGGTYLEEPMPVAQEYGKSRSAVDVLVNGLPVWSTAANYFYPENYDGGQYASPYSSIDANWGYASEDDQYKIFVGRFDAGVTFTVDFIVRADAVARAPKCGKESEPASQPNPRSFFHCYLVSAGRDLPASPGDPQARFEMFSEIVSALPYPSSPIGL
jgi:hypothetical protein